MAPPNDSSTGGYLSPAILPSLDDAALANFLQSWVAGITGVPGQYVRPRWQSEPPNIPLESTDWAAIGVIAIEQDTFATVEHFGAGDGLDQLRRHEILIVLASFYGAGAGGNAALLCDGMQVAQNREPLMLRGMAVVDSGARRHCPEIVKMRWLNREDVEFRIRRQVVRDYAVLNLLSAPTNIDNEHYHELTI